MWVATSDLPRSTEHLFYTRLNEVLEKHDFDGYPANVGIVRREDWITLVKRMTADGGPLQALVAASPPLTEIVRAADGTLAEDDARLNG